LNEVTAAAQILTSNASDVSGNNLPLGGVAPVTGNGIPTHFTSFGQVGTVFNDATTKLVGGVFNAGPGSLTNSTSITADLTAVNNGLHEVVAANPATFTGTTLSHVFDSEAILGKEITAVAAVANAGGNDPGAATQIHLDQVAIINIVQHDTTFKALAAPDSGFQPLPAHSFPSV